MKRKIEVRIEVLTQTDDGPRLSRADILTTEIEEDVDFELTLGAFADVCAEKIESLVTKA